MTYILIFQVFKTSRQRQRKNTRLYEGTEKGWLKKTSKLLKRGWFGFFLNSTVLVNIFNKHYLLFDNNFYLCPKCLEKDSLSQHCSSVQTHHDSDLSSVAAISVSCGQLSADSESISELRNKKIRANCSWKTKEGDQFSFKPVRMWCHCETPREKFCEKT